MSEQSTSKNLKSVISKRWQELSSSNLSIYLTAQFLRLKSWKRLPALLGVMTAFTFTLVLGVWTEKLYSTKYGSSFLPAAVIIFFWITSLWLIVVWQGRTKDAQ